MTLLSIRATERGALRALLSTAIAMALNFVASDGAHASVSRPRSTTHLVTTCDDDVNIVGSLRQVLADPTTVSGDVVDMSQLTCSYITVGSVLPLSQDDLTLLGPAAGTYLALTGTSQHPVLRHTGHGTLTIEHLAIVEGYVTSDTSAVGGCIASAGSVHLLDSRVARCRAHSMSGAVQALGGGVFVKYDLALTRSDISESQAYSSHGAAGGGAFVGRSLTSDDSTIARNRAYGAGASGPGLGGGVYVNGSANLRATTIAGNRSDRSGGMTFTASSAASTAHLVNSTVSGNIARIDFAGVYSAAPLEVANSTIAFNQSKGPSSPADGLYVSGGPGTTLVIASSIIADNIGTAGLNDLGTSSNVVISGAHNIVVHATPALNLPGTTSDCPRLDPLTPSYVGIPTHIPREGSPAIDQGDDGGLTTDQRGAPRISGPAADIGAAERQPSDHDERMISSSFEGPCDI